jgi:hypothetical protein
VAYHPATSSLKRFLLQVLNEGQVLHLLGSIKDLLSYVDKKHAVSLGV